MSENVYFYKGKEANLPKSGIVVGGLYHCTDTKNTYIGISATKMELWANGAIKRHTVTKADGTQTIAGAGTETTVASGVLSFAEGNLTNALGKGSHAEGGSTYAEKDYSHAEGGNTKAQATYSHTEGYQTVTKGEASHAEGYQATAIGKYSHAEGYITKAKGEYSHAEGDRTIAKGNGSHAEGGRPAVSDLRITYVANARECTYSGTNTLQAAVGDWLVYNDSWAQISEIVSSANTLKLKVALSTSNLNNQIVTLIRQSSGGAYGDYSHVEGYGTAALNKCSHAEGYQTKATVDYQHVQGKYNKIVSNAAFIVGNGSSSTPSNAHVLKWNGDAYYAGNIYAGSAEPNSANAKKLATESQVQDVDDKIGSTTDAATANTIYGNIAALKGAATDDKLTALTLHGLDNRTKFMLGTANPSNNHTIQNALNEARQADADAENAYKLADAALPLSGNKKMTGSLQTSGIILDPNIDYGPKTPSINNGTGQLFFQEDDSTPIKVIDLSQYCDNNLITVQFARVIMANNYPILLQMQFIPKQNLAAWTHIIPQTAGLIVNASRQTIYDTSNQYGLQVRSTFVQTASAHNANSAYTYNFPLY